MASMCETPQANTASDAASDATHSDPDLAICLRRALLLQYLVSYEAKAPFHDGADSRRSKTAGRHASRGGSARCGRSRVAQ